MPLTKKQRDWVLERNGGKCQYCWKDEGGKWHRCGRSDCPEVHHIIPEGFANENVKSMDPNSPENLITLCSAHHTGKKRKRRR